MTPSGEEVRAEQAAPVILPLQSCASAPITLIGGKAAGLSRLMALGWPVPPGFVVTTIAQRRDLSMERLAREIDAALMTLGPHALVAVRSSCAGEDGDTASFAGQFDTALGVRGSEAIVERILACWAGDHHDGVDAYRRSIGHGAGLSMAVVVQEMVPAEVAGVMMTLDPVSGDRSQVCIEATFGLGVVLTDGEVNPDRYRFDKVTGSLRVSSIGDKARLARLDPDGHVVVAPTPEVDRCRLCLSEEEAIRLGHLAVDIERAFGGPQDIEWAITPGPGARTVHLLQTRPETRWGPSRPRTLAGETNLIDRLIHTAFRR